MSFDLIVKGGTLPDGRVADIGIRGETIVAVEPKIEADAGRVIDAGLFRTDPGLPLRP